MESNSANSGTTANRAGWKNLTYSRPDIKWNHEDPAAALQQVNDYAEHIGDSSVTWYYRKKAQKARLSRMLRYGAIVFTALAGLFPIVGSAWPKALDWLWATVPKPDNPDLFVSLFVGLTATCIAIDRFGGFSTGWIRYIRTAAEIQKLLHEFRMDWANLEAAAGPRPSAEQVRQFIVRAREFVAGVQTLVLQETQAWATEFESNLSQMEKEAKDSFEKEKQELKAKLDQAKPANLSIIVTNANQTDGLEFRVFLDGSAGGVQTRIVDGEVVKACNTWTRLALPAGPYAVTVTAQIGGKLSSASKIIETAAGKTVVESLTLLQAATANA